MSRYFATGLSGFVGRSLIKSIQSSGSLTALDRSGRLTASDRLQVVRGELAAPETYGHELTGIETVIHLAATTGKVAAGEHHRVNVLGTRALLEACLRHGVRRLMYISTIAAKYPDKRGYPYAESKLVAENLVRQSGLDFVIVRPTIVAGESSPVMEGLSRMAALPILPLFGGGRARLQPIHVDDLTSCISAILTQDAFEGDILELGGPEVITLGELLSKLRTAIKGRSGPALNVPMAPVLPVLRLLETLVGAAALPVTAGQLSLFRFDSTGQPNQYYEQRKKSMRGVAELIAEANPH